MTRIYDKIFVMLSLKIYRKATIVIDSRYHLYLEIIIKSIIVYVLVDQ